MLVNQAANDPPAAGVNTTNFNDPPAGVDTTPTKTIRLPLARPTLDSPQICRMNVRDTPAVAAGGRASAGDDERTVSHGILRIG